MQEIIKGIFFLIVLRETIYEAQCPCPEVSDELDSLLPPPLPLKSDNLDFRFLFLVGRWAGRLCMCITCITYR